MQVPYNAGDFLLILDSFDGMQFLIGHGRPGSVWGVADLEAGT